MTSDKAKSDPDASHPSDTQLQGAETLDLYLSEIGRNMMAVGEQSALLLAVLSEQVTLLRELDSAPVGPVAPTVDRQETEQEHEAVNVPGAVMPEEPVA